MRELKYQCSKCLEYKHENEFSKNKCYVRGINYLCKQCNQNYYKSKDKKIKCEICGSEILKSSLAKHNKVKRHLLHEDLHPKNYDGF
jgi:DNA-directed RNA polymerase subunit RPC12/RpoP